MSETLLVALDQGTTSTRAALFGLDGRERASAQRPLAQSYPADGWVEHDPEEIFTSSVEVLRQALDGAGPVAALGIANQRETAMVWDRDTGRPIAPAIVWQDRRTAAVCDRLRGEGVEAMVAERTGLRLDPYFSATKFAWLLDRVDGAGQAAAAGRLLCGTVDSWLIWRLTGRHLTDATNASRTLLFDLRRQVWDRELCALFGVPIACLPEVRDTVDDYGTIDAGVVGRALPIRGVAGDQQAGLIGQGCTQAGQVKATFGTGAFLLLHTGAEAVRSEAGLLTSVASRIGGQASFCVEGSIFSAGAAVQWVVDAFDVADGPAGVERAAAGARAGHGVVLVPAFTGLGAPWWDSEARATLSGLTRDSGLPEIAAAAIDAAAHGTADLLDAMRADFPNALTGGAALRIDGGMASSQVFPQRLADLSGLPVERADYTEATALGAAMLAGVGASVFSTLEEAAAIRPRAATLTPTLPSAARSAARARWLRAVGRVVHRPDGA